jgi:hypothetical protein
MAILGAKWNVNVKADDYYNHAYNKPTHKHVQNQHKIVFVNEKQLFEGIVAGVCVAASSIILFKSGLTTKAFKRVTYDWLELKVVLGIIFGWMVVWCFRKTSNVLYDRYVAVNGRTNPYEISINTE